MMNIINFYKENFLPRYANLYGMELYNYDIDFNSSILREPYGDYSKGIFRENQYGYDDKGVFIFIENNQIMYNPCGVAEYALICFEKWCRNETLNFEYKNKFILQIDWLIKNATIDDKYAIWYYNYPNEAPFFSGISQGMIICVLLRAYQILGDKYYYDLAIKANNFMNVKVEDGGIRCVGNNYDNWYAEGLETPYILNGHIYSLLGLWDLYRVSKDENIYTQFMLGVNDIKRNIKEFDLGFYTKYVAGTPYPSGNSYHYTHITQFKILAKITNDKFFENYANKFIAYHNKSYYKIINFLYLLLLTLKQKISNKN